MSAKATVIVTVYKRTQFIQQALQSAIDQTLGDIEIIVTDDSAHSEIQAICDSLQDSRIRYRTNACTLGVALNLRAALAEAKGEYIAILNDDDVWEPEFLEKLVAPLEKDSHLVLSFSDHWIILQNGQIDVQGTDENTVLYGRNLLPCGIVADLADLVLRKNGVPLAMASVFRKDALDLELLVKDVSGAYDFWISCLLAASNRPAYYVPERLTRYRIHETMETARKSSDKNENIVYIYRRLIDSKKFTGKEDLLFQTFQQYLYHAGRDNLLFNQVSRARAHFLESLAIAKDYRTILSLIACYFPKQLRKTFKVSR